MAPSYRPAAAACARYDRPLDLERVGAACDVAVHNANHGTLCRLLLAGTPMLQLPITLEQKVLARAADRLGASETAPARALPGGDDDPVRAVEAKLDALLCGRRYAVAARAFAAKYASFDPGERVARRVGRLEEWMGARRPSRLQKVFSL